MSYLLTKYCIVSDYGGPAEKIRIESPILADLYVTLLVRSKPMSLYIWFMQ